MQLVNYFFNHNYSLRNNLKKKSYAIKDEKEVGIYLNNENNKIFNALVLIVAT